MGCISDPFEQNGLIARAEDTLRLCDRRGAPCFLGFLDEGEQAALLPWLKKQSGVEWMLFGGFPEAERRLLGVFPEYIAPEGDLFPLTACAFHHRKERRLTHRDVLGTLLSAGLRRETVGDILCAEGLCVAFLREEIVPFVREQIEKIGGEGGRWEIGYTGVLPAAHSFVSLRETVASPRLDGILKALLHIPRDEAARLITEGAVQVDHRPASSVSAQLDAPCVLSVRGFGRFALDRLGPVTRKGRLNIEARKYI